MIARDDWLWITTKATPSFAQHILTLQAKIEVRVRCTREQLRLRAANETAPITQIYRQEVQGLVHHPGAAARMTAYESVAATMYKDRHANMPPLPVSLRTVAVPPQYQQELTGQPFLMCSGPGNKLLLFSTVDNLTALIRTVS
jgi:hypothetical protein